MPRGIKGSGIKTQCKNCGNEIVRCPSEVMERNFCSQKCAWEFLRGKPKKKRGKEIQCIVCGRMVYIPRCRWKTFKYCQPSCRDKDHTLKIDDGEIVRMYQLGISSIEIGKRMGVSWSSIVKRLKKNGVKLRSKSENLILNNPTKGKGHTDKAKQKIREATQRQFSNPKARALASHNQCVYLAKNLVASVSGVEDRVAKELDRRGIAYKRQVPIKNPKTGRYGACVDFLINGFAVEVNGTYWHSDPRVYPNGPISQSQKKTDANYKKKMSLLQSLGIRVVEIWEMDVDKDIVKAVDVVV